MSAKAAGSQLLRSALADRTREELGGSFDILNLQVMTDGFRVMIDGDICSYQAKKRAGAVAAGLVGRQRVMNRLRVIPYQRREDAGLRKAVQACLIDHPALSDKDIAVSIRQSVVTLEGKVSSRAASCQAELAVWAVGGVADVDNRLRVDDERSGTGPGARRWPPDDGSATAEPDDALIA